MSKRCKLQSLKKR
uniref:Uncharacterized protein n=1 Tax=Arundo donax TaxID=35708 RepID=A0A0A9DTX1_ARUDO